MRTSRRSIASLAIAASVLGGCVERRIWVETDPPGALVWLNDAQIGRSPVDVSFTHQGVYDLRIEKDGFEPIVTGIDVRGPVWDQAPLDFFAELAPGDSRYDSRWAFRLRERDDSDADLARRALELRDALQTRETAASPSSASGQQAE